MRATREAFGEHLPVMGEKHNNIVALDADLGKATKIASFGQAHPERFFQMGIAEANMIGERNRNKRPRLIQLNFSTAWRI